VTFDLVVGNPTGIASTQTLLTVSNGGANQITAQLIRTDLPVNSSMQTVKFEGTADLSSLPAGAYSVSAAPITSLNSNGSFGYATSILYPTTSSQVIGAQNLVLIRNNGDLNYSYPTFTGPSYNKSLGNVFVNPKYNTVSDPIWKVGETFNPTDYFELTIPTLPLKINTATPKVCTSTGTSLTLIATGGCSFTVYTDKTSDYQYFKYDQTVAVTDARTKPVYVIAQIPTQSSAALPLSIPGPYLMGPTGLVTPVSLTPSVCFGAGFYINITSGGTCTLTYSTAGTTSYLPSDLYTLTFQVARTAQTIAFNTPANAALSTKSLPLSATTSSGQLVTFLSSTPTICSVTGNSLILLNAGTCQVTASQNGTTTIAPISAVQSIAITGTPVVAKAVKKLLCIKNGKTKTVSSKTCPSGYKVNK
jgi:ribosomal protein S11